MEKTSWKYRETKRKQNETNKEMFKSLALQTLPLQWDRARSAKPVEHWRSQNALSFNSLLKMDIVRSGQVS